MLSMIGLIGGLALLIFLTMRGMNLLVAGPLSALFVAVLNGMPLFPQLVAEGEANLVGNYMSGFSSFVTAWYLMFLLGAIFGKVMEDSGAADSVSRLIVEKLGMKYAILAIVAACAVLTYGGVSLFVVAFSVYPMALSLFKQANLPRRFIPAALAFGSVTFTMTSAGSPEIQNWIPIDYLNTSPYAGWEVSLIVAIFMMIFGYWWLKRMISKAVEKGEHFVERDGDPVNEERELPNPLMGVLPLIVVLAISFIFHDSLKQSALIIALLGGVIATYALNRKYFKNFWSAVSEGTLGALIAIGNTAAVVGYVQWQSTIASHTQELGITLKQYSVLWTINGALIVIAQPIINKILKPFAHHIKGQIIAGILIFILSFAVASIANEFSGFLTAMVILTVGEMLVWPAVPTIADKLAPKGREGFYQGIVNSTATGGRMIGPLLGGVLVDLYGHQMMLLILITLFVISIITTFLYDRNLQTRKMQYKQA